MCICIFITQCYLLSNLTTSLLYWNHQEKLLTFFARRVKIQVLSHLNFAIFHKWLVHFLINVRWKRKTQISPMYTSKQKSLAGRHMVQQTSQGEASCSSFKMSKVDFLLDSFCYTSFKKLYLENTVILQPFHMCVICLLKPILKALLC